MKKSLSFRLKREIYLRRKDLKGQLQLAMFGLRPPRHLPSISICVPVKDRFDHLEQTFIKNLTDNDGYPGAEFLLLNYDCPDSRTDRWARSELTPWIERNRVSYHRYENAEHFNFAHAQNLAFRLARGDLLCNLGADTFLGRGFLFYVASVFRNPNVYLRGPVDKRGLGGRICLWREDWLRLGGYDERLTDWGGDDKDLARRLEAIGREFRTFLPEKFCRYISHSDDLRERHLRTGKQESKARQRRIWRESARAGILNPNGDTFGKGHVQSNFADWVEVG